MVCERVSYLCVPGLPSHFTGLRGALWCSSLQLVRKLMLDAHSTEVHNVRPCWGAPSHLSVRCTQLRALLLRWVVVGDQGVVLIVLMHKRSGCLACCGWLWERVNSTRAEQHSERSGVCLFCACWGRQTQPHRLMVLGRDPTT